MIPTSDSEYQRGYADGCTTSQVDSILANLMRRALESPDEMYVDLCDSKLVLDGTVWRLTGEEQDAVRSVLDV